MRTKAYIALSLWHGDTGSGDSTNKRSVWACICQEPKTQLEFATLINFHWNKYSLAISTGWETSLGSLVWSFCCMRVQPSRVKPLPFSLTDLYEHKFINCRLINSTFMKEKEGCHIDFEEDNDFLIYLVSFLGSLSVLPGNIISALLMDKIGRIKMIGEWGWWWWGRTGWSSALQTALLSVSLSSPKQKEQKDKDQRVRQVTHVSKWPTPCLLTLLFCDSVTFFLSLFCLLCQILHVFAVFSKSGSELKKGALGPVEFLLKSKASV